MLKTFGRAETGATAIEYALIASLVSIFIIGSIALTGNSMTAMYNLLINAMKSVLGS